MNYRVNKTNPFDGADIIVEEFSTNGPAHPISNALAVGSNRASTSLLLQGRGTANYGERIAENLIHILENFSGSTPPSNPINGQQWACRIDYVQTASGWFRWDNGLANWIAFTPMIGTPSTFTDGEFWFDNNTLRRSVNQVDNPLTQTAIELKFASSDMITDPNAAGYRPSVEILSFDNGTWISNADVFSAPIPPSRVSDGKFWYDTMTDTLKIYLDGSFVAVLELINNLTLSGGVMTGDLDMDGNAILNIPEPTNESDPTTKAYVDGLMGNGAGIDSSTIELFDDVVYTSPPITGDFLQWNNVAWIPSTLQLSDISDLTASGVVPSEIATLVGSTQNINTKFSNLDTQIADLQQGNSSSNFRVFYQLPFSFQGVLPDNTIVARTNVARPYVLEAQAASDVGLARGSVAVAPTAPASLNIRRNGTVIGTATIATGSTAISFSVPITTIFEVGDLLEIESIVQNGAAQVAVTLRVFDPNSGQDIPADLTLLYLSRVGGSVSGPIISTVDIEDNDPDGTLVTKKYVDALSPQLQYVTLLNTIVIGVGPNETRLIDSYPVTTDPLGIVNAGLINLSSIPNIGTTVAIRITAYVRWQADSSVDGIRNITISGAPAFSNNILPITGVSNSHTINTGIISVSSNAQIGLEISSTDSNSTAIDYITFTLEIIDSGNN